MKFLVQMMVMFSDVIIVLMAIGLFYAVFKIGNAFFALIAIALLLMTYKTWKETGGLITWTKKGRKTFFNNWDK